MASYLQRFDETPAAQQWPMVRRWMFEESLPFFAELRRHRPVLATPQATLVARYLDCCEVLLRYECFSVKPYDKMGEYWMAQDDTPAHWRDKSIMRAILDREQVPDIRKFIGEKAASILKAAGGEIEAVSQVTRAVPIALVQEWFGFVDADPKEMFEWSHWGQYDDFHNLPFDAVPGSVDPKEIHAKRLAAGERLREYLIKLVTRRAGELKAGQDNKDPVSRLLRLSFSGGVQFDVPHVAMNVGGLLVGAVETTSQAVIHSLAQLLGRPEVLAKARAAAAQDDPSAFDGYAYEGLRFHPISPYMFRTCERPMTLAAGTDHATKIEPGTMVLPLVQSAMFDEASFPEPEKFDPTRPRDNTFHLGFGLHECLGRPIAEVMIPELVRQFLRLPGLQPKGPIDYAGGPFPEKYWLRWTAAKPKGSVKSPPRK